MRRKWREQDKTIVHARAARKTNNGRDFFSLDSAIGQALAGTNGAGGIFSVRGGFRAAQFAPTAAGASISGRVTTGVKGIRNVQLTLTSAVSGEVLYARSGLFGAYRFENVPVGQSCILTVSARRFSFAPNTRIIMLPEELTGVDFIGTEQF